MVSIQASFLQAQDQCIPNEQQRGQETCMDKRGASSKSQMEGRNLWDVKKGIDHMEEL